MLGTSFNMFRTLSTGGARNVSVLAWGANDKGQCGVETSHILTRPTVITELYGQRLQALAAGFNHSMAILANGSCMAWGSDVHGQLGLGGSIVQSFPSSIEALVSREFVKAVALSESHSLLLGASGLWAAGSNKHGACGIDTGSSLAPSPPHLNSNDFGLKRDKVLASKAGLTIPMQTTGMHREGSAISAMMAQREKAISVYLRHLMTPYIKPKVPQEVMDYRIMMQPFLVMNGKRRSSLGGLSLGPWNAIDPRMSKEVAEVLIQPDLILSPVRVGLGSFVSVSASSCYSIGCTSSGEVWSWGGTSRHQGQEDQMAGPRPLTGELAEEIRSLGGAVKVAAGLNFALALTAEGKVVAWSTDKGAEDKGFTLRDFPAISEISAGSDHALITDGARVWSMSRGVDQEGIWQSLPKEEIDLSSMGGVVSMTCGQTSSSVVSGDGGLWMWGCLLEPSHAHSLLRKKRGVAEDQPALSGDDAVVNWNGFGSIKPAKVECLSHLKVKYVALGSHHALVSVE